MAQDLEVAASNLKRALETDSELKAWSARFFAVPAVRAFLGSAAGPVVDDPDSGQLPAVLVEFSRLSLGTDADEEADISVLGAGRIAKTDYLVLGFIFKHEDAGLAWSARCQLTQITARLLVRNRTLSGAVGALFPGRSRWEHTKPPIFMLLREVRLEYQLEP